MKTRVKRSKAFFGMHFDFHATEKSVGIGKSFTGHDWERLVNEVRPDYIQCDTKGHPGFSSYKTKYGTQAPDIRLDILKEIRRITKEAGVSLYAHHSGVFDGRAVYEHPEYAAVAGDGTVSTEKTSVFGKYADERLIKQLIELATDYKLDGAWVDGECWAVITDFSDTAKDAYRAEYGEEPPSRDSDDFIKYAEFCRRGFLDYVKHYVNAVHSACPDFEIASNWLFSTYSPYRPEAGVDFISGDYSPNNSFNSSRVEGRYLCGQGLPWDLMAWSFSMHEGRFNYKSASQLCQEASEVIALGGGFQMYEPNVCDGIKEFRIPVYAQVAEFCRARENLCHNARIIPQVGVLYDTGAFTYKNYDAFSRLNMEPVYGTVQALLDSGIPTEILKTHVLLSDENNINEYGAVCVPDCGALTPEIHELLLSYAEKGGNLILFGANASGLFSRELGAGVPEIKKTDIMLGDEYDRACFESVHGIVAPSDADTVLGYYTEGRDDNRHVLSSRVKHGKGTITGVYISLENYQTYVISGLKRFVLHTVKSVYTPNYRVSSPFIDVIPVIKDGQLRINLVNTAGEHRNLRVKSFDNVPELYNTEIEFDTERAPVSVCARPEEKELAFTYENGVCRTVLDKLAIHTVICVTY